MISNLEKYKNDLAKLIKLGDNIIYSFQFEILPELKEEFTKDKNKKDKDEYLSAIKKLPCLSNDYQKWYSESIVLLSFLLPDRVEDFTDLYKKPKTKRKDITHENYVIEDALIGLEVSRTDYLEGKKIIADKKAAFPKFQQQLNILKSVENRFESTLFDIKQLVQADIFDSELESAKELNKKGFVRGAGAVAGVVLEKHLTQVCENHNIKITKKDPAINDFNQILKDNSILEIKDWRFIQHLADLRNLCDHNKKIEPKKEDIEELIAGIEKISKTIF
ncbi:MAG: hypothetical protein WC310_05330 [Patescibacteria group bacterium]|jgi:hypothetical protein